MHFFESTTLRNLGVLYTVRQGERDSMSATHKIKFLWKGTGVRRRGFPSEVRRQEVKGSEWRSQDPEPGSKGIQSTE